ncbi:MAG: hypothetical protein MI740_05800 [Halanaerobiales bacterium]|nr:hypothetical protein [Halanaerobiales bacterium]
MMMTLNGLKKYVCILVLFVTPTLLFAQGRKVENISDTTDIKGQFEYLLRISSRYEQYKVIPISGYNHVKGNSLDSINMYKREVAKHLNEITELNSDLSARKDEIEQLNEDLQNAKNAENSIKLLGIQIKKGAYNLIVWAIILILAGISVITFLLYKRGHQVVKSTKERLTEVQEEFETHRKNTLVREQKLARELMDVKLKSKSR